MFIVEYTLLKVLFVEMYVVAVFVLFLCFFRSSCLYSAVRSVRIRE